ncbi:unnamed protein product [Orchesella dallaii]|uniref:Uncharacterized protein n=1 Tax=Orchesella dallaii TaxID=48710 RepID=A0ABP1PSD4_9HEXA
MLNLKIPLRSGNSSPLQCNLCGETMRSLGNLKRNSPPAYAQAAQMPLPPPNANLAGQQQNNDMANILNRMIELQNNTITIMRQNNDAVVNAIYDLQRGPQRHNARPGQPPMFNRHGDAQRPQANAQDGNPAPNMPMYHPGMMPWGVPPQGPQNQRSPEALAKIQARTMAFQARREKQHNQMKIHSSSSPQPVASYSKPQRQVIRLRDVETQTDPVIVLPQPTSDQRKLVIEEDERINRQKTAERNRLTLKAKQQHVQQLSAVVKEKKKLQALMMKEIPEPSFNQSFRKKSSMRPATITKPVNSPVGDVNPKINQNTDTLNFDALFGPLDAALGEKPPTPSKSNNGKAGDSEDDILKDL